MYVSLLSTTSNMCMYFNEKWTKEGPRTAEQAYSMVEKTVETINVEIPRSACSPLQQQSACTVLTAYSGLPNLNSAGLALSEGTELWRTMPLSPLSPRVIRDEDCTSAMIRMFDARASSCARDQRGRAPDARKQRSLRRDCFRLELRRRNRR